MVKRQLVVLTYKVKTVSLYICETQFLNILAFLNYTQTCFAVNAVFENKTQVLARDMTLNNFHHTRLQIRSTRIAFGCECPTG